ncbi:hypothetical protein D3C86_1378980 [compost metagenome]
MAIAVAVPLKVSESDRVDWGDVQTFHARHCQNCAIGQEIWMGAFAYDQVVWLMHHGMPAPDWMTLQDWVELATIKGGLERLEEAEREVQRAAMRATPS